MTGRGRGRGGARSSREPSAGSGAGSRRTTRQQQHQPRLAEQPEDQAEADGHELRQLQMHIDPAITDAQDAGASTMPPPPLPTPRSSGRQPGDMDGSHARRSTRRDREAREPSLMSVNSVSNSELQSSQQDFKSDPAPAPRQPEAVMTTVVEDDTSLLTSPGADPASLSSQARVMQDMLRDLADDSEALFNHLCLDTHGSETWQRRLRRYQAAFEASCSPYVRPGLEGRFLDQNYVSSHMPPEFLPSADRVIKSANLAWLLYQVVQTQLEHEAGQTDMEDLPVLLEDLDSVFPRYLVPLVDGRRVVEESELIRQILEIRTHRLILALEAARAGLGPPNPWQLVSRIFCNHDGVPQKVLQNCQNDPEFPSLIRPALGMRFEGDTLTRYLERVNIVCKFLPNEPVEFQDLAGPFKDQYPLSEFLDGLQPFAKQCFVVIKNLPSPPTASQLIAAEASQITSQLESDAMPHGTPSQLGSEQGTDRFQSPTALALATSSQFQRGDYNHVDPASSYPAQLNNFIAYEAPPSSYGSGAMYAQSAALLSDGKKRAAPSDAGASEATPPPKKKRQPRRKGNLAFVDPRYATPAVPPISPLPAHPNARPSPHARSRPSLLPAPPRDAAASAMSVYDPPPPPTQPPSQPLVVELEQLDEADVEAVARRAREQTSKSKKAKEPQVRHPWDKNDILWLIKAVDLYKCKWSAIEKAIKSGVIKFKIPRDQQALRDKARLLKQDLLKTDSKLPAGFDHVVLGKKEREAVIACGKNPFRTEADILNGKPVRTEYHPSYEKQQPRVVQMGDATMQVMRMSEGDAEDAPHDEGMAAVAAITAE